MRRTRARRRFLRIRARAYARGALAHQLARYAAPRYWRPAWFSAAVTSRNAARHMRQTAYGARVPRIYLLHGVRHLATDIFYMTTCNACQRIPSCTAMALMTLCSPPPLRAHLCGTQRSRAALPRLALYNRRQPGARRRTAAALATVPFRAGNLWRQPLALNVFRRNRRGHALHAAARNRRRRCSYS